MVSPFNKNQGYSQQSPFGGGVQYNPDGSKVIFSQSGAGTSYAPQGEKFLAEQAAERARQVEETRKAEEAERFKRERETALENSRLKQEKISRNTISGQVKKDYSPTSQVGLITQENKTPISYISDVFGSSIPFIEKVKKIPSAFNKNEYQNLDSYKKQEKKEADIINLGKQEIFGGVSLNTLLPYQKKGTAIVTNITPYTEEEIAGMAIYPKGSQKVLEERKKEETRISGFETEQKVKEEVLPEFQKKVDLLGESIIKEINSGLSYNEAINKYKSGVSLIEEEANNKYEKRYVELSAPISEEIDIKYNKLFKKQQRGALIYNIVEQIPLITGSLVVSPALPPSVLLGTSITAGVYGLSELSKDKGGKYYETKINTLKDSSGKITGYNIESEKLTGSGYGKLLSSSALLIGGTYGLYKKGLREIDIETLKNLNSQKATITGAEVFAKDKTKIFDVYSTKGYKFDITKNKLEPIGEAQQISNVKYSVVQTGDNTFSVPIAKGNTFTRYFSYEKNKWIETTTPITATARGKITESVFGVKNINGLKIRKELGGWSAGYGKGILIKEEGIQSFSFGGISKKTENIAGYTQVKTLKLDKIKMNVNVLSDNYGKKTLVSSKVTGEGLIKNYIKENELFTITGNTVEDNIKFVPVDLKGNIPSTIYKSNIVPKINKQTSQIVINKELSSQNVLISGVSKSLIEITTPVLQKQKFVSIIIPENIIPQTKNIIIPKQKILIKDKSVSRNILVLKSQQKLFEKESLKLKSRSKQPTKLSNMQNVEYIFGQYSRLNSKQLQKTRLKTDIIGTNLPITNIIKKNFFLGGIGYFSLPKLGIPFGSEKSKKQIKKQSTGYQPSFTASILNIRRKIPKNYEQFGYGGLQIRAIPILK